MSTINGLLDRQYELFTSMSRTIINLKKKGEANITEAYVRARLAALQDNWTAFKANHVKITDLKTEAAKGTSYFSEDLLSQCEEMVIDTQAALSEYLMRFEKKSKIAGSDAHHSLSADIKQNTQSRVLPQLSLPKFSGVYKEWCPFRDLFESMVVNNASIPEVEKFHYLKLSVVGEAAQLISNLIVTGENFKLAWCIISDRYENHCVLVDTQLELLFSLRRSSRESATELKRLYGTTIEVLGALNGLKCDTTNWDPFIVYWVSRKFDPETLREWELHISTTSELPTLAQLNEFLVQHIRALESMERVSVSQVPAKSRLVKPQVHLISVSGPVCPACKSTHSLATCPSYLAKSFDQRKAFVTQLLLCFNCLGAHQRKACRSKGRCNICKARHHTSLHETPNVAAQPSTSSSADHSPRQGLGTEPATSLHVAKTSPPRNTNVRVLLATALVKATSSCGESSIIRVLLDQGSEVSFVPESLVQRLNLPRRHANVPVRGIGAGTTVVSRGFTTLTIASLVNSAFNCTVRAFILPKLTAYLPDRTCNIVDLPHINGLTLADPDLSLPLQVDLVIGVETYSQILLSEVIRGPPHTPIAQRTELGWILTGPAPSTDEHSPNTSSTSLQCCVDRELVDLLQRFWQQEEESACKQPISKANLECENHFVNTHTRDDFGRFQVRLPFIRDVAQLGSSRHSAYRLLCTTEKRLASNPVLRQAYLQFLEDYEKLGHMRRVTISECLTSPPVYLPHHCVLREASSTTKLRVVFNGSFPTSSGVSLNECLHSGPKIQNDLADVLLRWRQYAYAFSADIEKMYRQIRVHEDDQVKQCILWRHDMSAPVCDFALTTVTYGLACAPFLALRCLRQLAQDDGKALPLASYIISKETYVDEILSGSHSVADGREKIRQLIELLSKGCFRLHKWILNCDNLLEHEGEPSRSNVELNINSDASHRALGLAWNVNNDAFLFTFSNEGSQSITKRSVLSTISQLFDPLGFIAPVIVQRKIMMQEMWAMKLG